MNAAAPRPVTGTSAAAHIGASGVRGLWVLAWLQLRGRMRRAVPALRTVKGALLATASLIVLAFWLGPSLWMSTYRLEDLSRVRQIGPQVLLGMFLLTLVSSSGDKAIVFVAAEVDWLFPGPFTRRHLLFYKIAKIIAGTLFSALVLFLVLRQYAGTLTSGLLATFLAMLFMQFLSIALALLARTIGQRAFNWTRKVVLGLISAAVMLVIWPSISDLARDPSGLAVAYLNSTAARIIAIPFVPFVNLLTSGGGALDLLQWTAICTGMIAATVAAILMLDGVFLETAVVASQRHHELRGRLRRHGITGVASSGGLARLRVPQLPYAGGAGPIAWRQLVTALRASRGMLLILIILAMGIVPVLVGAGKNSDAAGVTIGLAFWLTVIIANMLHLDFRGDLDQIETLKALPLSPLAVAAGQLVAPTLVMSALHLGIFVTGAVVIPTGRSWFVVAALMAPAVNALIFALDNTTFLMYPTRAAASPSDLIRFGKQIVLFIVRATVLVLAILVALIPGIIAFIGTRSWVVAAGFVWGALWFEVALVALRLARTFSAFDVSRDMPT